jgi:PBSX family phage terminase large subunit
MNEVYKPLDSQKAFHDSNAQFRALIGGVASGKTTAGCMELLRLCTELAGSCCVVFRMVYSSLNNITRRVFLEQCPKDRIKSFSKYYNILTFKNDSKIYFRSIEQLDSVMSKDLDFVYIDDASEVEEEVFRKLSSRLKKKNKKGFITSKPTDKKHWIYKRFVESCDSNYFVVNSASYENPYLPEEYKKRLEAYRGWDFGGQPEPKGIIYESNT